VLAGLCGALLGMCGNAFIVVFPVAQWVRVRAARGPATDRAGSMLASAVFVVVMLAFHAWRFKTFGSLVAHAPGFGAGRASMADLFVAQPNDIAPFGWFYVMAIVLGAAGTVVVRNRLPSRLALATAVVTGLITLLRRDALPGLAGSAPLVPLLAIPVAGLVDAIPRESASRALRALLTAALLVSCAGWAMNLRVFARHVVESYDVTLAPLGQWLAQWRPDGSMLCDAPGAVPYLSGWRTALVGDGTTFPEPPPDVVLVTSQGLFDADLSAASSRVAATLTGRYRVLAAVRAGWTRDRAFILYARDDVPELTDAETESFPQGLGTVARLNR
jgi:hypothetical protein